MKTCPQCGTTYLNSRVLCLRCNEILEEQTYLKLVFATTGAAFAVHFLLSKLGYPGRGLISETLKTEVLLLIGCVAVWKLVQKWRDPKRNILYELASLYSDRAGRAIILAAGLGLVVVSLAIASQPPPANKIRQSDPWRSFVMMRARITIPVVFAYIALVVCVQGKALVNFRLKNALEEREIRLTQNLLQRPDLN